MKRRIIIAVSIVSLFIGGAWLTGSRGQLEYFSPYTLELHSQSEFTLWHGEFPVYRSGLEPVENDLISYIKAEGFVTPVKPATDRRDVVYHWNEAWKDGDGDLYRVLHRNKEKIIAWSKEDRQRAESYWSEGFRYLRSGDPDDNQLGESLLYSCWHARSLDELKGTILTMKSELGK